MVFKTIRPLIHSSLILVIGEEEVFDVDISDPKVDIYNYYEVISIRANYWDNEEYIEISLKPTISDYYTEAKTTKIRDSYASSFMCKK